MTRITFGSIYKTAIVLCNTLEDDDSLYRFPLAPSPQGVTQIPQEPSA